MHHCRPEDAEMAPPIYVAARAEHMADLRRMRMSKRTTLEFPAELQERIWATQEEQSHCLAAG